MKGMGEGGGNASPTKALSGKAASRERGGYTAPTLWD